MTISVANNRPADRNYVVYVVIEETLGSGVVLHTVERIPVTGQLTFVPQSFFDDELEAHARMNRFFRDFAMRYAKSLSVIPRPGGPGSPDPMFGLGDGLLGVDHQLATSDPLLRELQGANFAVERDFQRLASLALRHPPAAQVLRQTLIESNLSEAGLRTVLDPTDQRATAVGINEQL